MKGTNVYNLAGDKLGSVEDIMIDKVSGRAIYAVMSFGGFLGMGEQHHPLPWATLKYDVQKGARRAMIAVRSSNGRPTTAARSIATTRCRASGECKFLWVPELRQTHNGSAVPAERAGRTGD